MAFEHHDLLAGPRGRRLCLQYAVACAHGPVGSAFAQAVGAAAYDLDPGRGRSRQRLSIGAGPSGAAGGHGDPEQVASLLAALALPPQPDDRALWDALIATVESARYWQEPDGEDMLAGSPPMREPLSGVAAHIAASAGAAWWGAPLDRTDQSTVTWLAPGAAVQHGAAHLLARWRDDTVEAEQRARRERPADPRAPVSGEWWSTPPRGLTSTTRSHPRYGPVGLWLVEDDPGWQHAVVTPVAVPGTARVYEVDGPHAWATLCRRYPLDVTAARRHDWYRATGRAGDWVIPDWAAVAADVDAVHLSVLGYLSTAGMPVPVADGVASVLAGWNPDETFWLTDFGPATNAGQRWERADAQWVAASDQPGRRRGAAAR